MTNAYLCYLVVTCDYYFFLYRPSLDVIPLHLCSEKEIRWSLKQGDKVGTYGTW